MFFSDKDLYENIGKNIKKYRVDKNLTQLQLCERVGISLSYLSKLESSCCNKSISISCLNSIATVLNVEIENFFKECE